MAMVHKLQLLVLDLRATCLQFSDAQDVNSTKQIIDYNFAQNLLCVNLMMVNIP